ncbi:unnamed protein product [Orchesella dallaii]|uniref:Uncharacterized protein n=1 Tax=Orchesella dallaii TaxID=48710 RepID=A0ABP1QI55_9HEXA
MLYQCAMLEFDTVSFKKDVKNKLKAIVDDVFNSKRCNESDERIRFLYILLNCRDGLNTDNITFELISEGIRMYPNNVHYYELLCDYYTKGSLLEPSLSLVEKGLKKFKNNVKLLCHKAFLLGRSLLSTCRNTCGECRCCIDIETGAPKKKMAVLEAYQQFLKKAPKDHKEVPRAYYRIALVHMIISSDFVQMEYYYKLGKEAEKYTLPCHSYLYDERWCIEKKFVETVISESETGVHNLLENKRVDYQQKQEALGILERKVYLDTPVRRWMLTTHRRRIKGFSRNNLLHCTGYQLRIGKDGVCSVPRPTMTQSGPERMDKMRSITLREINPVADFLYENQVIDMTIIDVPLVDCYCPV